MIRFLLALIALVSGLGAEAATARVCDGAESCIGQTLAPRIGEQVAAQPAPSRFVVVSPTHGPLRLCAAGAAYAVSIRPDTVRTGIDRALI